MCIYVYIVATVYSFGFTRFLYMLHGSSVCGVACVAVVRLDRPLSLQLRRCVVCCCRVISVALDCARTVVEIIVAL